MLVGRNLLAVCLVGLMLVAVGCGADEAGTPQEAVENLVMSLEESDEELFMATVHFQNDEQRELGREIFRAFSGIIELEAAVQEEYGEGTGEAFSSNFPTKDELDQVKINEQGDTATATLPGEDSEELPLVKVDGAWKVDMAQDMAQEMGGEDVDQAKAMLQAMGDAAREMKDKVGEDGYSAERIEQEFGMKMFAAMMGAAGEEDSE